ncbi:uncharacterized protein N0V89_010063 [Didymosphaeria variabile]|uniref:Uncharacterized protein n=1 Tax=Didymosphaeria variabile TaxID=1932322 RepID=A0A9W8XEZ0_9PLEO|nr:uncharacterized protein N0V89_010063 [Didymosphaeria variabile]KAJ4348685.1 hypothetical protein N0V89_010063 [Didymosphaeria variabile]
MDFDAWLANNKALWARVYDEVITPDLEKEWKTRIETHEAESKKKDDRLQHLNNHISNGVVEKAHLVEENNRLKNLLRKARVELLTSTDDGTVSITEYNQVTDQLDELNKRYQDAAQRIKYLERKNVAVMQKNKEMKDSVKAWQEYCDRHIEKKKAKAESKVLKIQSKSNLAIETSAPAPKPHIPSSPGSAAMITPRSLIPQENSSPAPMAYLSNATARARSPPMAGVGDEGQGNVQVEAEANEHEDHEESGERVESGGRSSPLPLTENGRGETISGSKNDRAAIIGHFSSDKVTSSQTTVPEIMEDNEPTPRAAGLVDDDDDEPEFVFERSLKRKRKPSTGFSVFNDGSSDGTPAKPVRVKEELYSSPPPETAIHQLSRTETMDLDGIGAQSDRDPAASEAETDGLYTL